MKIPYHVFASFERKYFTTKNFPQRFGQAFMNEFMNNVIDADVFYETDTTVAKRMILDRYVSFGSDDAEE